MFFFFLQQFLSNFPAENRTGLYGRPDDVSRSRFSNNYNNNNPDNYDENDLDSRYDGEDNYDDR